MKRSRQLFARLRRRTPRFWVTVFALVCLLVNQWAAASYVCPTEAIGAANNVTTSADASSVTLPPCHSHADTQRPGLCQQHCYPTVQSAEHGKAPTVAQLVLAAVVFSVDFALALCGPSAKQYESLNRAIAPPLAVQFGRLLI
jgi:hypothetical protein